MPEPMPQVRPDELAMIRAAQRGDVAAQNQLIERHMAFICSRTMLALRPSQQLEEYLSYGVEAFIRAISTYDPARAGSLLSYADIAIRRRVWRASWADRVIAVPVRAGVNSKDQFVERRARAMFVGSIHPEPGDTDHGREPSDARDGERSSLVVPQLSELRAHLATLGDRQLTVLMLRALDITLREIATLVGLTHERVRQIELEAQAQLRELMLGSPTSPAPARGREEPKPRRPALRQPGSAAPTPASHARLTQTHAAKPMTGSPEVAAHYSRVGTRAMPR